MKYKYLIYILIFIVVVFRGCLISVISKINIKSNNENDVKINILENNYNKLKEEYNSLIDFKSNINIDNNYVITNLYLNNYSFDKMLINGKYHINDEVVNSEGLIGIVSNVYDNYSEVSYLKNTNITVRINDYYGLLDSKDSKLIVKGISNYSAIFVNDKIYSLHDTYLGKVKDIIKEDYELIIYVEKLKQENSSYVGVIHYDSWFYKL